MPNKNFQNIELYLNNELSPEGREQFEMELEKDDLLKEQLYTYREINDILSRRINASERKELLRARLKQKKSRYFVAEDEVASVKKTRKVRWLYTAVAAAAVLIILLWSPWQQNILSNYGQVKMTNPTVRSNEQDRRMTEAAQLFNNEEYKEAFSLLDSAVHAEPTNAQNLFYRGVTLLHLQKDLEARKDLNVVFEGQSIYKYQAAYFLALSYLQKENIDSCRIWLQKIPEDAAIYPKAQKLLNKVGR